MALSVLLLTGQSGSGKSTALRALEDHGHFCVDNVPTAIAGSLVEHLREEGMVERLVLVMDIRDRHFIQEAPRLVRRLRDGGIAIRVIYLDAREEALIRRYSETRRRHPLDYGYGLRHAIAHEREVLEPLRELADDTLDTTSSSPHVLRARIIELFGEAAPEGLRLTVLSFGFKFGLPAEADIVLDVRFLPNPYFEAALREKTGLDDDVSHYAIGHPEGQSFIDDAAGFLSRLIPQYEREGKCYLTVAVGCTGGQHRSVAVGRALAERLAELAHVDLRHRDIQEARR